MRIPPILAALLLGILPATAAEAPEAALVARFNAALIGAMQGGAKLGFAGRYALVDPVAREVFDFPGMTRLAAGPSWAEFSAGQQQALIDAFSRLSVTTYAARFNAFSGERFEVSGTQAGERGTARVANRLIKSDGTPVSIDYVLRQQDGAWRIADVYLDAKYSEMAVRRSEYASVLKTDGLAGLLERIEQRIAQMQADGGP